MCQTPHVIGMWLIPTTPLAGVLVGSLPLNTAWLPCDIGYQHDLTVAQGYKTTVELMNVDAGVKYGDDY